MSLRGKWLGLGLLFFLFVGWYSSVAFSGVLVDSEGTSVPVYEYTWSVNW